MGEFQIAPRGPFSLAAARDFLCAFTPAAGGACAVGERLTIGFRLDGSFAPIAVSLAERAGAIAGWFVGDGEAALVARQVARILSLDGDGAAFAALAERDPPLARAFASAPGFRPVVFPSPYEAAAWGLIAARLHMRQAAAIKRRLAVERGDVLAVDGAEVAVFPSPEQVLAIETFAGLPDEKLARLHGVARAALDGKLDADRLRALPRDRALDELTSLRGVGAWTAAHILIRGAGTADELPLQEPRLHRAVAFAYDLPAAPDDAELERIAEKWRPFRTWVSVLLVAYLGRSGKWESPDDAGKRGKRATPRRGGGRRPSRSP